MILKLITILFMQKLISNNKYFLIFEYVFLKYLNDNKNNNNQYNKHSLIYYPFINFPFLQCLIFIEKIIR